MTDDTPLPFDLSAGRLREVPGSHSKLVFPQVASRIRANLSVGALGLLARADIAALGLALFDAPPLRGIVQILGLIARRRAPLSAMAAPNGTDLCRYRLVEHHHLRDEGFQVPYVLQAAGSRNGAKIFGRIAGIIGFVIVLREQLQ
jgi:hypothetical protein